MIGLVIVTHGGLATEFRAALEHIVGPQSQLETVAIGPEDDMAQRRGDILDAVKRADTRRGRDRADRHVRWHAIKPRHFGDG